MAIVPMTSKINMPAAYTKLPEAAVWYKETYDMWHRWRKPESMTVGDFQIIYLDIMQNLGKIATIAKGNPSIEDEHLIAYAEFACMYISKSNSIPQMVEAAKEVCKAFKSGDLTQLSSELEELE